MRKWLKRLFCKHVVYIEDIERVSDDLVIAFCHKCRKPFAADYGLALSYQGATLDRKPTAIDGRAEHE